MKLSQVFDFLKSHGRDPLEILLDPPPADIAEMLVGAQPDENIERDNDELAKYIRRMPPHLRNRLHQLIQERVDKVDKAVKEK